MRRVAHNINVSHLFSKVKPLNVDNVQELLKQYNDILDLLLKKEYIRTRNAPIGDLAEYIVLKAVGGKNLENNSNKSFDLIDRDGKKCRLKRALLKDTRVERGTNLQLLVRSEVNMILITAFF